MKKTLLLLSFFINGAVALHGQCTIQTSCTPTGGYCATPAANSNIPNANELTAYSTVIQITLASTWAGNTINSGTLTSVTGLPTGLSYSANPTNGVISGGGSGCILITGTPALSTTGTYTLTANINLSTSFGMIPGTLKWTLTVLGSTGITTLQAENNKTVVIAPNPAFSQINVIADFHFKHVTVFDALGNKVITQEMNGSSDAKIDVSHISHGIYFVHVSDGNNSLIRKFIKE